MTTKKNGSRSDEERKAWGSLDIDSLSVRRLRLRHDETRVPRGHKRAADDWPVQQAKPNPKASKPTDGDRALFADTIEMMRFALACEITDEMRARVRAAYVAIAGHEHGDSFTAWLGALMRQRAQAETAERIRAHRRGAEPALAPLVDGRPDVATSGAAIAEQLRSFAETARRKGAVVPAWLADERLPAAIDAVADQVNLGGAGGRSRGKTPEKLAAIISKNLSVATKSSKRPKK